MINTGERERERERERESVHARVRVIKNVNYTDQDGNTETGITFLILIKRGMQMFVRVKHSNVGYIVIIDTVYTRHL